MKPKNLKTRIFLDGGNLEETKEIKNRLGFLDGQTTNPSLVSKNPKVKERLEKVKNSAGGDPSLYRDLVKEISQLILGIDLRRGLRDRSTSAEEMLRSGRRCFRGFPMPILNSRPRGKV
jgi:transaldolase